MRSAPASAHAIEFHGGDALERPAPELPPGLPGTLMLNPPYGERIDIAGKAARPSDEDRDTPSDFFPRLASHWKRAYTQHPAGWTAWVLSPDMKLPGAMRLKAVAARADVERADRMPAVPLRAGGRLGALIDDALSCRLHHSRGST